MIHSSAVYPEEEEDNKRLRLLKRMRRGPVQRLLDYLKVADRLESAPGFSHALHLNHDRLLPQNFWTRKNMLTYRHLPPPEICMSDSQVSLGTYLAVMDEVTTWALLLNGKRPGVSINLHAEWGPAGGRVLAGQPVDIIATVQKVGRSLGFVQAEILQEDRQVVSFGGHVKFLKMKFWQEALLLRGWPLVKLYSKAVGSKPTPQTFELKELFKNIHFKSFEEATFTATTAHASHGGALHGGCQSILMELVGEQTARDALSAYKVELESINISYQSPGTPSVVIHSKVMVYDDNYVKMKVTIRARTVTNKRGGRIISEGLLQWRSSDAPSSYTPSAFSAPAVGSCYKGARRKKTRKSAVPAVRNAPHTTRLEDIASEDSCSSVYTPGSGYRFDSITNGDGNKWTGSFTSRTSSALLPPSLRLDHDDATSTASPKRNEHARRSPVHEEKISKPKRDVARSSSPGLLRQFDPFDFASSEASSILPPVRNGAPPAKSDRGVRKKDAARSLSPESMFDPFDVTSSEASTALTPVTAPSHKDVGKPRRSESARSSSPGLRGRQSPVIVSPSPVTAVASSKRRDRFNLFACKKEKSAKATKRKEMTTRPSSPGGRGEPDESSIQTPNEYFQIPFLNKNKGAKKAPSASSPGLKPPALRESQDDVTFPSIEAVASFEPRHVSPFESNPVTDFEPESVDSSPFISVEPQPESLFESQAETQPLYSVSPQGAHLPAFRLEDYDVAAIPTAEVSTVPFATESGRGSSHSRKSGRGSSHSRHARKKWPPSSRPLQDNDVFLGPAHHHHEMGHMW